MNRKQQADPVHSVLMDSDANEESPDDKTDAMRRAFRNREDREESMPLTQPESHYLYLGQSRRGGASHAMTRAMTEKLRLAVENGEIDAENLRVSPDEKNQIENPEHMPEQESDTADTDVAPVQVPAEVYHQLTDAGENESMTELIDTLEDFGYGEAVEWVRSHRQTYRKAVKTEGFVPRVDPDAMRHDCPICGGVESVGHADRSDDGDLFACVACGSLGRVTPDGDSTGVMRT